MNDVDRQNFGTAILEIKESLDQAVEQAGGNPAAVGSLDRLTSMTAFELLCTLSTNSIRFVYNGPRRAVGVGHNPVVGTKEDGACCNHVLANQGQAYPRTCARCGLGPCRNGVILKGG